VAEVVSRDGTRIAYDRTGHGPPLILVGGVFSYRAWPQPRQLAELLSPRFTVVNYDRRGRGESGGHSAAYAVQREIEDIEALIDAVGGSAHAWGLSSGGVLALKAAAAGAAIERLAVYEPPFVLEAGKRVPPDDFVTVLSELAASGREADAARYFFNQVMGMPALMTRAMPLMRGPWRRIMSVSHSAAYEALVIEDNMRGRPLRAQQWEPVTMPTMVISGQKSDALLRAAARALVEVLPNGQLVEMAGQSHNVSMKALAPLLEEFFYSAAG